jgi:hypothetical protein
LVMAGIGIRGLTLTRFFPQTASSTVRSAGASILPGARSVLRFPGEATITITSAPTTKAGDRKRITPYRPITATAFTTLQAIAHTIRSVGLETAVSIAVGCIQAAGFMESEADSTVVAGTAAVGAAIINRAGLSTFRTGNTICSRPPRSNGGTRRHTHPRSTRARQPLQCRRFARLVLVQRFCWREPVATRAFTLVPDGNYFSEIGSWRSVSPTEPPLNADHSTAAI